MLVVQNLASNYGKTRILHDFSLSVARGEIVCLLGRNGAGKTSALKSIMGFLTIKAGQITLDGRDLHTLPAHQIARAGLGYVPQGRRLFGELTVGENLRIGLLARDQGRKTLDWVMSLFPKLQQRLSQRADLLSGGEQQTLAMARALCMKPELLLLDEPMEGLMPSMVATIQEVVLKLRAAQVAVIWVEHRIDCVLAAADRIVFVENGRTPDSISSEELLANKPLLSRYVAISDTNHESSPSFTPPEQS